MRMRVDEARRRDLARRIHFDVGLCAIEAADLRDAVTTHADVAIEARRPAAVDDGCVPDQ